MEWGPCNPASIPFFENSKNARLLALGFYLINWRYFFAVVYLTFIRPPVLRHRYARHGLKYWNILMDLILYSLTASLGERSYFRPRRLGSRICKHQRSTRCLVQGKSRTQLLRCCWWWWWSILTSSFGRAQGIQSVRRGVGEQPSQWWDSCVGGIRGSPPPHFGASAA
jgi:hypothetical protein